MLYAPQPLHIPDGFLSVLVSIVLWIVSIIFLSYALKRVGQNLNERQVPMMGVLAAAIFAGQMLNFTVAGGTSGHLMGAAIATILLGPWSAMLVLTCVVTIQALIFQDGGLLVLGANTFNMAIIGVAVAYMAYRSIQKLTRGSRWGLYIGGFLAAWLSIEVVALGVALQLAISGTSPANIAIPTMGAVHALIGIGEGLITIGALGFLYNTRRDLLQAGGDNPPQGALPFFLGLVFALLLAVASPFASSNPDGLEWVAEQNGFLTAAQAPLFNVLPDYAVPGVSSEVLATIIAGVFGALIVFGIATAVAYTRRTRRQAESLND